MSHSRLIPALLIGLVISVAATACRKSASSMSSTVSAGPDTLIPCTFITTSGTFTHTEGMTTRSLNVTPSGTSLSLDYSSREELPYGGTTESSSENGTSISSPTDPWFVYIESPERFWFFDGKSGLHNFYPDGGTSGPAISSGKIQRGSATVPTDVILRLPDDLRKLFPPVEPPVKRPSL